MWLLSFGSPSRPTASRGAKAFGTSPRSPWTARRSTPVSCWASSSPQDEPTEPTEPTETALPSSSFSSSFKIIENVSEYCGVKPPQNYRSIPLVQRFARWTWRRRVSVLHVLHWKDPLTPVDSCINVECLWWKVLSTTDRFSPCWEPQNYTYDMLPRGSRRLVILFRRFHPRWIHALLEVRAAYLTRAIQSEREATNRKDPKKPSHATRLISLGAGYDVRSVRLLQEAKEQNEGEGIDATMKFYEIDLPSTIESKQRVFQQRFLKRQTTRRNNMGDTTGLSLPTMIGLDLNDIDTLEHELAQIFQDDKDNSNASWHTIFVVEGVLMYLTEGKAAAVLQACATTARVGDKNSIRASLCFADRLFDRLDCDPAPIQQQLAQTGWELSEWAPSPNANAKHMGIARLKLDA